MFVGVDDLSYPKDIRIFKNVVLYNSANLARTKAHQQLLMSEADLEGTQKYSLAYFMICFVFFFLKSLSKANRNSQK